MSQSNNQGNSTEEESEVQLELLTDDELTKLILNTDTSQAEVMPAEGSEAGITEELLKGETQSEETTETTETTETPETQEAKETEESKETKETTETKESKGNVGSKEEKQEKRNQEHEGNEKDIGEGLSIEEEFFNKVTGKMKANGTEVQIKDADQVIRLMQQGIGYSGKMQNFNNDIRLSKPLKEANAWNEEAINLFTNVLKGNKDALALLAEKGNIDISKLDFSEHYDEAGNLVNNSPDKDNVTNNVTSEEEFKLNQDFDNALQQIHDSGNAAEVRTIFDNLSPHETETLSQNPELIVELNEWVSDEKIAPLYNEALIESATNGKTDTPFKVFIEKVEAYRQGIPDTTKAPSTPQKTKSKSKPQVPSRQKKKIAQPMTGIPSQATEGSKSLEEMTDDEVSAAAMAAMQDEIMNR